MKLMKFAFVTGLLCIGSLAMAQDIHFDYDRSANFSAYRTYQWVEAPGTSSNQLMDQNIRRAVDAQLAGKGLRRVESGGDLQASYKVAISQEKEFNGMSYGPRWNGGGRVSTSTVDIGKIAIELTDPAKNQLVWRGDAGKTLDIKKDPEKNYKNLEKAMAKLFKNYPPGIPKD
jgi:hypothetical protein